MQKTIEAHILVSVIMPVYNPGICFRDMLESLHNQSLQRMEVICVLDCPKDGSELLLDEYVQKDSRFVIIKNQQNKGVGESRNIGLQIAKGEFVGFCDDDDSITLCTYYEDLYYAAKQSNADVVMSDVIVDHGEKKEIVKFESKTTNFIQIQSLLYPEHSPLCRNRLARSVWHSIYKRSFVENKKIHFYNRSTHLEEDTLFNLQVFTQSKAFVIVPYPYYCWNLSNPRNQVNYQSQNSIHALKAFFDVVYEQISSSPLLSAKQKNILLKGCLSVHFYQKYCIYRDINVKTMLRVFGCSLKYLSLFPLLHVCLGSHSLVWKNRTMLVKYAWYVVQLKCYYFAYLCKK